MTGSIQKRGAVNRNKVVAISYVIAKRDPVEPERLDWVFLFLIFVILGIHFKSN